MDPARRGTLPGGLLLFGGDGAHRPWRGPRPAPDRDARGARRAPQAVAEAPGTDPLRAAPRRDPGERRDGLAHRARRGRDGLLERPRPLHRDHHRRPAHLRRDHPEDARQAPLDGLRARAHTRRRARLFSSLAASLAVRADPARTFPRNQRRVEGNRVRHLAGAGVPDRARRPAGIARQGQGAAPQLGARLHRGAGEGDHAPPDPGDRARGLRRTTR